MKRIQWTVTVLALALLLTVCCAAAQADGVPWSGSGTEAAPWLITSAADLVALRDYVAAGENTTGMYFKQTADISLSTVCGEGKGDWTPIGSDDDGKYFNGTYDGGSHTISGLYIGNGGKHAALFIGLPAGTTVRNLTVAGYVKGGYETGGVAGWNKSVIENCGFSGTVITTEGRAGGIAGFTGNAEGSKIVHCTVGGDIVGATQLGGIVGALSIGASVENCEFTGRVSSTGERAGGIAGNTNTGTLMIDCTVYGDISGTRLVGGIAGFLGASGEVNSCRFTGTVSSTEERAGGIAGSTKVGSLIVDCSADGNISCPHQVGGIAGYLNGEANSCYFHGTVSCTGENAGGIAGDANDCSSIDGCTVDGDITGGDSTGGIAGQCYLGTVKNCTYRSGTVTGKLSAGGIVGFGKAAKSIENCKSYGTVKSTTYCAGGIAGQSSGPISDCENHGAVYAPNYAGGIAAHAWYAGTLENCKNYGSVTGENEFIGGIVGWAETRVICCENHGRVEGYQDVGGIAGDTESSVINCMNDGQVSGHANVGSIVGHGGGITIILKPNGAPGDDLTSIVAYGRSAVPECSFIHPDFCFFGWNTAADGTGTWYSVGDSVSGSSTTLYAIWMYGQTSAHYFMPDGEEEYAYPYFLRSEVLGLPGGWYIAEEDVTFSGRLVLSGDVNLILAFGKTITCNGGIQVPPGSSLTIWSGNGTPGTLTAAAAQFCAGIGGNRSQSNGPITINGGTVNATGYFGAGIGGGDLAAGGTVIINGGTVNATGGKGSAGIGGGGYGSGGSVTINGGTVSAVGSVYSDTNQAGAGIGAGRPRADGSLNLSGGSVTINGGTVTAAGGTSDMTTGANAIGANFQYSDPGTLTIADGLQAMVPFFVGVPVDCTERVDTCRNAFVKIEPCSNHTFDEYACHYCGFPMTLADVFSGWGTEYSPFLIRSADDWNALAEVCTVTGYYLGDYWFRLTEDISVTTMIGTADAPFSSKFDGGGHTLTFNADNNDNDLRVAPFAYVRGATIRNLRTAGSITGSADRASGLIGENREGTVSHVTDCRVSMSLSGRSFVGAFCIGDGGGLTIEGCVFDGTLSTGSQSGGFVGWTNGNLTISNSVFAPGSVSAGADCYTFCYKGGSGTPTVTNSYWMTAFGTPQGKQAFSVTAGNGITIDFGTPDETYNVSGITAYAAGLIYSKLPNSKVFYAGAGDQVNLRIVYGTAPSGTRFNGAGADKGELTDREDGVWTLTMPDSNVGICPLLVPMYGSGIEEDPWLIDGSYAFTDMSGWYMVTENTYLSTCINVSEEVHLILPEGRKLEASKGFTIGSDGSLAISGEGKFITAGTDGGPGITGSGTVTFADGLKVTAEGAQQPVNAAERAAACAASPVTIEGCDHEGGAAISQAGAGFCAYCNKALSFTDIGSGTAAQPYRIGTAEIWNMFAAGIENGFSTQGKYFVLTNSISVTAMIGTQGNPFAGVFDGQGNTLTFTCENHPEIAAPFRYISGAIIRNLHVAGSITGTNQRASGLIGENSGTSLVINCHVSATISGSRLIGGFCIGTGNTLTITGSVFDGKITGGPNQSGCFVAWGTGGLSITHSIAAPQDGSVFTGGTFCHNGSGAPTLTNCYCMQSPVTAQARQAFPVTAGDGVTLGFGTLEEIYSVSGITAYRTGLLYGGVFYAGAGETVTLIPTADSWDGYALSYFAGETALSEGDAGWTLTMPEGEAEISFRRTPAFATAPTVHLTGGGGTSGLHSYDGPEKLFDGDDASKWCCVFDGNNFAEFHSDVPIVPTAYSMTTGGDAENYLGRNPYSWQLWGSMNGEDGWTKLADEKNSDHLPAENCAEVFFPLKNSAAYQYYRLTVGAVRSGNKLQLAEFKLVGTPVFGTAAFTLPNVLTTIEESAFEGMAAMTVVDAHSVNSIGRYAFKDCTGLTRVKLQKDCTIDAEAFAGCGTVYIFAPAGGSTEAFCSTHANCVFMAE